MKSVEEFKKYELDNKDSISGGEACPTPAGTGTETGGNCYSHGPWTVGSDSDCTDSSGTYHYNVRWYK